jgi:hypothetical protein
MYTLEYQRRDKLTACLNYRFASSPARLIGKMLWSFVIVWRGARNLETIFAPTARYYRLNFQVGTKPQVLLLILYKVLLKLRLF